mgnify:CR=1 FL=1
MKKPSLIVNEYFIYGFLSLKREGSGHTRPLLEKHLKPIFYYEKTLYVFAARLPACCPMWTLFGRIFTIKSPGHATN